MREFGKLWNSALELSLEPSSHVIKMFRNVSIRHEAPFMDQGLDTRVCCFDGSRTVTTVLFWSEESLMHMCEKEESKKNEEGRKCHRVALEMGLKSMAEICNMGRPRRGYDGGQGG